MLKLTTVPDTVPEPAPQPVIESVAAAVTGPRSHIIFTSSSSDTDSEVAATRQQPQPDEKKDEKKDEDEDELTGDDAGKTQRSAYVGRGNVEAVRLSENTPSFVYHEGSYKPLL